MRYLIVFSYDGTKFHGFQRQIKEKSVQGSLEKVLSQVLNETIVIKGSGRTDALVHALGQGASFDTNKRITKKDIKLINKLLNGEIFIRKWRKVKDSFHARHNVLWKKYVYQINIGDYDIAKEGYYYQIKGKLNLEEMNKCLKLFVGTHDFRHFVSGQRDNYETTIYSARLRKKGDTLFCQFVGVGFYRYMVRHLVGALIDVGRGKKTCEEIASLLDRPNMLKTTSVVPGEGLYLVKIKFDF